MCNLASRGVRADIVAVGKGISSYYIFREYFCSSMCPECAILSSVVCPAVLCFPYCLIKGAIL